MRADSAGFEHDARIGWGALKRYMRPAFGPIHQRRADALAAKRRVDTPPDPADRIGWCIPYFNTADDGAIRCLGDARIGRQIDTRIAPFVAIIFKIELILAT